MSAAKNKASTTSQRMAAGNKPTSTGQGTARTNPPTTSQSTATKAATSSQSTATKAAISSQSTATKAATSSQSTATKAAISSQSTATKAATHKEGTTTKTSHDQDKQPVLRFANQNDVFIVAKKGENHYRMITSYRRYPIKVLVVLPAKLGQQVQDLANNLRSYVRNGNVQGYNSKVCEVLCVGTESVSAMINDPRVVEAKLSDDTLQYCAETLKPEQLQHWEEQTNRCGVNPDWKTFWEKHEHSYLAGLRDKANAFILSGVELPNPPKYPTLDFLGFAASKLCNFKDRKDLTKFLIDAILQEAGTRLDPQFFSTRYIRAEIAIDHKLAHSGERIFVYILEIPDGAIAELESDEDIECEYLVIRPPPAGSATQGSGEYTEDFAPLLRAAWDDVCKNAKSSEAPETGWGSDKARYETDLYLEFTKHQTDNHSRAEDRLDNQTAGTSFASSSAHQTPCYPQVATHPPQKAKPSASGLAKHTDVDSRKVNNAQKKSLNRE